MTLHDPHHRARAAAAWRRHVSDWRADLPPALRSTTWPMTFAGLVILALLLGFHQVVVSAVQQGEILRMSAATRAEAVHQCNMLRAPRVRASCLQQIDQPPVEPIKDRAPPNTAALSVAQAGR